MTAQPTANIATEQTSSQPCHAAFPVQARVGDIVTVDLDMTPEDGFVPEYLFDVSGRISFILGWGNYLPGLHALVEGMRVGESAQGVSIDAGWGERNPDLIVKVPLSRVAELSGSVEKNVKVGDSLSLKGGIEVVVVKTTETTATVDANPPLAGSSYACSLKVLSIDPLPESTKMSGKGYTDFDINESSPASTGSYAVATLALGCFWGGELAFMRVPGVVGTKVGYTQGEKVFPTYEEVCEGSTQHRESVHIVYDTRVVSYEQLLDVHMERLAATEPQFKIDPFAEEHTSSQYKHGIYFHSDEQRRLAQAAVDNNQNEHQVEILQAARFYHAESYHQQYLLKGGQSARKGAKETIRCFG